MSANGFGCYTRDGRGRLALWDWTRGIAASHDAETGTLTVKAFEGTDLRFRSMGTLTHTATRPRGGIGSSCTVVDPAARKPLSIPGRAGR